jgi:hypothetical protein
MKKKGQLTVFIILGIILLVSASFSIYLYSYIQEKKSETRVITMLNKPGAAALAGFCSGGMKAGECSNEKPFICEDSGELVADCSVCGCPPTAACLPDGNCEKPVSEATTNFTIYFLPINYDAKSREFLERVTLIKLNLAQELGLNDDNFVVVDEPLLFPTEQCDKATTKFFSFVDSWLQQRLGQGLPGVSFTGAIPVYKYAIIGIDKNEQELEKCGCGYNYMPSPNVYIGGASCGRQEHSVAHELGHVFALCDEYDTCVWEDTSELLSNAFGHPCFNAKPDKQNSDCGDRCCAKDRACCAGKYADFKQEAYSNIMGSSDIPPKRRMSTETKLLITGFLCANLGVCG